MDSFSLKDKRMRRSSIIKRLQNKYKIAVAEVGDYEIHNSLYIACANVSNNRDILRKTFDEALNMIERDDVEVYDSFYEEY